MRHVVVAAYADKLVRELETTRRRLAHLLVPIAVGSSAGFGSPGVGACLLELARWRPGEGEYEFLADDRGIDPGTSAIDDVARAGAGDVARGRIVGGGADGGADGGAEAMIEPAPAVWSTLARGPNAAEAFFLGAGYDEDRDAFAAMLDETVAGVEGGEEIARTLRRSVELRREAESVLGR